MPWFPRGLTPPSRKSSRASLIQKLAAERVERYERALSVYNDDLARFEEVDARMANIAYLQGMDKFQKVATDLGTYEFLPAAGWKAFVGYEGPSALYYSDFGNRSGHWFHWDGDQKLLRDSYTEGHQPCGTHNLCGTFAMLYANRVVYPDLFDALRPIGKTMSSQEQAAITESNIRLALEFLSRSLRKVTDDEWRRIGYMDAKDIPPRGQRIPNRVPATRRMILSDITAVKKSAAVLARGEPDEPEF